MYDLFVTTSIDPERPILLGFESAPQREMWFAHLPELMQDISAGLSISGAGITAEYRLSGGNETGLRPIRPQDFETEVRRQFHDIYATP